MSLLLVAAAGILTWSLAEYLLHRFLGHDRRTWPNAFAEEHTRHHSQGDYFAPSWKKALVAGAVFVIVGVAGTALLDLATALTYSASFAGMYVTYEVVHRRAHTHRGLGAYGRWLRRHHFHHHFGNPRANHGVTSPVWDVVFGTFERAGRVRVPEKMSMRWLIDGRTGDVHADLAPFYELIRRPA